MPSEPPASVNERHSFQASVIALIPKPVVVTSEEIEEVIVILVWQISRSA